MSKRYRMMRVDEEIWNALHTKKSSMEAKARRLTGKPNLRIPMIRVMNLMSKQPLWLDDDEVYSATKRRRRN